MTVEVKLKHDGSSFLNYPWTAVTQEPHHLMVSSSCTRKGAIRKITRKYKRFMKNQPTQTIEIEV